MARQRNQSASRNVRIGEVFGSGSAAKVCGQLAHGSKPVHFVPRFRAFGCVSRSVSLAFKSASRRPTVCNSFHSVPSFQGKVCMSQPPRQQDVAFHPSTTDHRLTCISPNCPGESRQVMRFAQMNVKFYNKNILYLYLLGR